MNVRQISVRVDKSNHDVYLFNSDRPFHHYASGQLTLGRAELPKLVELGDAYELLVCANGQCHVDGETQRQVLKRGACLLVPPHTRLPSIGFNFSLRMGKNGQITSELPRRFVTAMIWAGWQIT